jgi:putative flippase GtrA
VTCPTLLRRPAAVAERLGELGTRVHGDSTLSQFVRFVLVGGTSTAVYAALFVLLSGSDLDYLLAHVSATVVSTVVANEWHRRLTFHAEDRVDWFTAQWEAGGVAAIGLVTTSAALALLDSTAGSAPMWVQIALVATVTGLIGLLRFVALRWIFRPTAASPA